VRIGLLGPLSVVHDGADVPVTGGRLRALLTQLALAAPHPVSPSALAESLWPDAPPSDVANAIQSLVSRLRRALGPAAGVVQSPAGYALQIDRDDVDVHEFSRLARTVKTELAADRLDQAEAHARQAVALWRGSPPEELAAPLAETLSQVEADLLEIRLRAGEAGGLIADLEGLARANPLRERSVELLMRALVADGRPAEALATYQRLRETLAEELGADPSPALQQLHVAVLRGELATPATAPRDPLPAALTSFIGREEQLKRIAELLSSSRLVTLVGPGGAGKTRLATEAARAVVSGGVGVWLAELAPVVNPLDVAQAVYDGVGLREAALLERTARTAVDVVDRLVEALVDRAAVLVIDNCEHVLEAAAQLANTLLTRCPKLRIVTTSREPLGVVGESLVPVPPLESPTGDSLDAADFPAMRLFADRAAAVSPGFELDPSVIGSVAEIVRRLDGLPLAIELAAARMRSMPVEQIANRLSDRFRLLAGGNRAAAARHRTLRAVVEWSWELLDPEERASAERLAVFSGSISVAAAEAVVDVVDVESRLASLVDKSLLQLVAVKGEPRYRMLETIREYGLDRLSARGEVAEVRRAHAGYFQGLARAAEPKLRTADQLLWFARLDVEQPDLLAALKFLADTGAAQAALELALDLAWYWMILGRHAEVTVWCRAALDADGERSADTALLAEAFYAINAVAWGANDHDPQVAQRMEDLRGLSARLADVGPNAYPMLVMLRPIVALFSGDDRYRDELFEDALRSPDPWVAASIRSFRAAVAENAGDLAGMREDATISLAQLRELGDRWGQANSLQVLGQLDLMAGDLATAEADYLEALQLTTELGAREDQVMMRLRLVDVFRRGGRDREAREQLDLIDSTLVDGRFGSFENMFTQLLHADLALSEGRIEDARRLQRAALGRVDTLPDGLPTRGHGIAVSSALAAKIDVQTGDLAAARRQLAVGYAAGVESRDMPILAIVGVSLARLALATGRLVDAARILGACAQLRGADDATNLDVVPIAQRLRAELPSYETEYANGRALTRAEAIARLDPAVLEIA